MPNGRFEVDGVDHSLRGVRRLGVGVGGAPVGRDGGKEPLMEWRLSEGLRPISWASRGLTGG